MATICARTTSSAGMTSTAAPELASTATVIALDVGGTSVKSGRVRVPGQEVSGQSRMRLDSGGAAEAILSAFARCILDHAKAASPDAVAGVALAFPGPFEYDTGICRIAGVQKFESLFGLDIGRELAQRTGFPADRFSFVNDAEAAIAGEIAHGAARGRARVIGVTLGTGMGSGFFVDGIRQTTGPGVPANGGWLFDEKFEGAMADDCFSIRGLARRLTEAGLNGLAPEQAAAAARAGDITARDVFHSFGRDLGRFLDRYAAAFRADAILIAGGLSGAYELFGPLLQSALRVSVLRGSLGMDAPLLGAVDSFLHKMQR